MFEANWPYKLTEEACLKILNDIKNEDLKEVVQEYLNEVHEKLEEQELLSQAAVTQTDK